MSEYHKPNKPKKIPKAPVVDVDMDIDAECPICQRAKTDPVSAYCGHSFCWVCINEYLLASRYNKKRRCPVCGIDMEAHVPGYGKRPKRTLFHFPESE